MNPQNNNLPNNCAYSVSRITSATVQQKQTFFLKRQTNNASSSKWKCLFYRTPQGLLVLQHNSIKQCPTYSRFLPTGGISQSQNFWIQYLTIQQVKQVFLIHWSPPQLLQRCSVEPPIFKNPSYRSISPLLPLKRSHILNNREILRPNQIRVWGVHLWPLILFQESSLGRNHGSLQRNSGQVT